MRLQKFLSAAGVCSRRKAEAHIRSGRVAVNDIVITELGSKVDPEADHVTFDGKAVHIAQKTIYVALNKPKGVVTSCRRWKDPIVIDLIDIPQRIYPVGRLDKDSTGLLILTNDGRLHNRLLHPSFDHEKEYAVTVAGPMEDSAIRQMETGVMLGGKRTRPAKIRRISSRRFFITLKEGRNRQIRRMVRDVGGRVTALERIRISNISVDGIAVGSWRYLTDQETSCLLKETPLSAGRR